MVIFHGYVSHNQLGNELCSIILADFFQKPKNHFSPMAHPMARTMPADTPAPLVPWALPPPVARDWCVRSAGLHATGQTSDMDRDGMMDDLPGHFLNVY